MGEVDVLLGATAGEFMLVGAAVDACCSRVPLVAYCTSQLLSAHTT